MGPIVNETANLPIICYTRSQVCFNDTFYVEIVLISIFQAGDVGAYAHKKSAFFRKAARPFGIPNGVYIESVFLFGMFLGLCRHCG